MRRKTRATPAGRRRAVVYTCALVALLAYGLPRIPELQRGIGGSFSVIWILFAGLAVAANLYFVLGADKERGRMLEARKDALPRVSEQSPTKTRSRSF